MVPVVKNLPANNAGDARGLNPWAGKFPWRRKWQPTPVFLPEKSHRLRSLVGYIGNGVHLTCHIPTLLFSSLTETLSSSAPPFQEFRTSSSPSSLLPAPSSPPPGSFHYPGWIPLGTTLPLPLPASSVTSPFGVLNPKPSFGSWSLWVL